MKDKYLDEAFMQELISLINIPSVYSEECVAGGPFGKDVKEALERVLCYGEKLGFGVKNYDGYAGELSMGSGEYIIGVLCHVDVVPAGKGWTKEPFNAEVIDGKLYGRGSSDDKGPLMVSMYAVKRLFDEGKIPENVMIRIIVGTNEEELWEGIKYYVEHASQLPNVSIVPDGQFPVIYCEKGLLDLDFKYSNYDGDADIQLVELYGGEGRNLVPAEAKATLKANEMCSEIAQSLKYVISKMNYDGEVNTETDAVYVTIKGKNAHAMSPEKGINAISQLISVLNEGISSGFSHRRFVESYSRYIGVSYNGEQCGLGFSDADSGKLTFNVGKIKKAENGTIHVESNVRYPASLQYEYVKNEIDRAAGEMEMDVEYVDYLPPVFFEKDSEIIKLLVDIYQKMTGDCHTEPIAMGGATYARAIPNAVSYGPLFPYEEELAHEADEYITIESLEKNFDIISEALAALAERRF